MSKFNIGRINYKKMELGERPLIINKTTYKAPKIKNGYLVDKEGNRIGTKGDMYAKKIMHYILQEGCLDYEPRPHYEDVYKNAKYDKERNVIIKEDGEEIALWPKEKVHETKDGLVVWTPAHTLSVNDNVECRYDLSKGESPLITLRPIAIKSGVAEILWIYQKESNDLVVYDDLLGKNTWDQDHKINNWWLDWAIRDENGEFVLNENGHPHIGAVYGETVRRRHILKEEVINAIKKNPDGRRNITCLWQVDDFKEPHGLKPCAFLTMWNVRHGWDGKDYLDMSLTQRSSDFATAGCINQVQYVALQKMVAEELNMEPGVFIWKPENVQLYDRHIEQAIEMLNREPITCEAKITVNEEKNNFDDFEVSDVRIEGYDKELVKKKNPQLRFPLGI